MTKSRSSLANSIRIVFASLFLCLFGALPAFATDGIYTKFGLDLGYAGRIGYMGGTTPEWAIYVYGAGTSSSRFNALDISAPPNATGLQVDGDIALAGVYSTLTVSGHTSISGGDRFEQTTSTESISSTGTITGSRFSSSTINSQLNSGVTSLKNVSIAAAGLTATAGSPTSINLQGQNLAISNNPFSGKYVMNLSNFVLGGGSTLTLNGAAGSAFVLNITGKFDIGGGSKVLLTGGLTVSDVLFNVRGSNSTFSIGGDSVFNGTLLAYNSSGAQRTLQISGHNTQINGELLANKIILQSGAHVKKPKEKSKDDDDDDDYAASNSMMPARGGAQ
jgi:Ice-binding-like